MLARAGLHEVGLLPRILDLLLELVIHFAVDLFWRAFQLGVCLAVGDLLRSSTFPAMYTRDQAVDDLRGQIRLLRQEVDIDDQVGGCRW